MAIRSDRELADASIQVGTLLQEIQDYVGRQHKPEAKFRFPRGFLKTASEQRARLPFVADRALQTNLAYTLMLSDVVLWIQWRTDLTGTAREMLTKLFVFLGGTLVESITKEYLKGHCGKNYTKRTEYLLEHGIITEQLQKDLVWLWDVRNNMHLFDLDQGEYVNEYTAQSHVRASSAFKGLIEALTAKGRLGA